MKELQRILSFMRRAVDDYHMIEPGDRIAVGVSGGKDSLTLLTGLAALRRFYPVPFSLCAIAVNMGFAGADYSPLYAYCEQLQVPLRVVDTDIANIIFNIRKESNPCSLCAKMRRGVLHGAAVEAGANRVALGHHFDDAVETFLLNLFYEGRLGAFSPVTYLSNRKIHLIRPLIYAQEKDVRYFVSHADLPVLPSLCPEDRNTERERIKRLLHTLETENKGLRHRIFHAMCKAELDGYRPAGRLPL